MTQSLCTRSFTGDPIDDYEVYWDGGSGGSLTLKGSSSNQLTYTVTGTTSGTQYRFQVLAVNFIGAGPKSLTGAVYAATAPDQPVAPTYVSATKTQMVLQLTAPSPGGTGLLITAYQVYMNEGGTSTAYADVTSTGSFDAATLRFTTANDLTTG